MRHFVISLAFFCRSANAHAQRGRGDLRRRWTAAQTGSARCISGHSAPKAIASRRLRRAGRSVDHYWRRRRRIWKTTDAGINWRPIFDDKDVSAVGALAVASSAHETVWAGTGEPWLIRPYYTLGDGVYKSTDAGRTWQHMGLDATGHIARIVIDPSDANSVYVCAIGQAFRTQPDRGVFHTSDGGATWKHVLAVNERTGCSDPAIDSKDPKTLRRHVELIVHRYDLHSGGPEAVSTSPTTAARRGTRSPATACRPRITRSAKSPSPCRRATRIASTRSCRTRPRRVFTVRTIAARRGSS